MNLHSTQKDLYGNTFLIGRWRRAKALTYLTRAMEPKAVDILVEAFLNGWPSGKPSTISHQPKRWEHPGPDSGRGV